MTIIIKKQSTKIEIEKQLLKLEKPLRKKSLRNVYGIFPIEGDAVEIQKKCAMSGIDFLALTDVSVLKNNAKLEEENQELKNDLSKK